MNPGGAKQVEGERGLRQKAIPFRHGIVGVDSAQNRDEVVLECANCSFSSIGAVLLGGDTLELDLMAEEGVLEILGAFVVNNVEFRGMALLDEELVRGLPGVANAGGFAGGYRDGMNGVGVLVVEHEEVIVAAAGGNRKTTCLVGIGLEQVLFAEKRSAELMGARCKLGSKVGGRVVVGGIDGGVVVGGLRRA
jgi:hypothetical protein